jgi:hypothetical protein
MTSTGREDGETRPRHAVGGALEVLVQHEEREGDHDDHRPKADDMGNEVASAPIADGQLPVLDRASQARQRRQATQRQAPQAGGQNRGRDHGDRPDRSVTGALEHGPVLRAMGGQEHEVMAEDQRTKRERREAEQVAPSLCHAQTVANRPWVRHETARPKVELLPPGPRRGGMNTLSRSIVLVVVAAGLVIAACSGPPGSTAGVTDSAAAARLALAQDRRFEGIGAYDEGAIGQAAWYKVAEATEGWTVTIRIGWGDCPAGCINEHLWSYAVTRGGQITPTGERGDPLPNQQPVSGRATAGPTCPVERNPPDPACAPRPVAGALLVIQDRAGAEVARVTTGKDGRFSVALAPGAYRLVPQAVGGFMGTAGPILFQVEAGQATPPLEVSYDTGIR